MMVVQNILQQLRKPRIRIAVYVGCVVCLGLGFLVWRIRIRGGATPISPIGGMTADRFHFAVLPIYRQNDPQWADEKLGDTQESLAAAGCTISSVSMALAHYKIDVSPDLLNARLKAIDGYTQRGWLKWKAVTTITDGAIEISLPKQPTHARIDEALLAQHPVIAKVLLGHIIPHWVLIVGKSGQEYLIKDPLGPGDSLENLSKFNSDIYAIRIVEHVGSDTS
jgi:hypothetical protein